MDTLTAAFAALGDFDEAVKWQTKARDMAPFLNKFSLAQRLKLYREKKTYRENAGAARRDRHNAPQDGHSETSKPGSIFRSAVAYTAATSRSQKLRDVDATAVTKQIADLASVAITG